MNPILTTYKDKVYLNVIQTARCLGVCRNTVLRWESEGYLPQAARVGKQQQRRFHRDELSQFIKANV